MIAEALFCAVALAAGIATSVVGQANVYPLNVAGYNIPIRAKIDLLLLGNRLRATNDNWLQLNPLSQFFKHNFSVQ